MLNKAKVTKTLGKAELVKKTLAEWDERGIKITGIIDMELKFGFYVVSERIYSSNHLNSVSCEAENLALKIVKNNMAFNLAKLLLNQFNKNMESIRGSKNNLCNFGSLITFLFFFVKKFFPSKGTIVWRKDVPVLHQSNEYIAKMGEIFDSIMDNYFNSFKENMNNRYRIPKKLVEEYNDDICFMVDCDRIYI